MTYEIIIKLAGGSFENHTADAPDFAAAFTAALALCEQGERLIGICETPDTDLPCFTQLPFECE